MAQRLSGHGRFDRAISHIAIKPAVAVPSSRRPAPRAANSLRSVESLIAEQLFSRIAGTVAVRGNDVRLLRDGAENYTAWLDAIAEAKRSIELENYIFRGDGIGRKFAAALAAKAQAGGGCPRPV